MPNYFIYYTDERGNPRVYDAGSSRETAERIAGMNVGGGANWQSVTKISTESPATNESPNLNLPSVGLFNKPEMPQTRTYYNKYGRPFDYTGLKQESEEWANSQGLLSTKPTTGWFQFYDPATGESKRYYGEPNDAWAYATNAGYTEAPTGGTPGSRDPVMGTSGAGEGGGETPSPEDSLLNQAIIELTNLLKQANKNGQIVNPGLDFNSPEGKAKVAEFLAKAEGEINPYYAGQLKLARDTLYKDLRYSTDEINLLEESYAKKYKTSYRDLGEQMAEKGLAYSGTRQLGEQELASTFGESLSAQRRATQHAAEQQVGQFAQQWGTRELPTDFNVPLTSFGAGQTTTRQLPLYTLSDDVYKDLTGSQEWGRQTAVKTRASELEGAFRTQEQIDAIRKLNLMPTT